MPAPKLFPVLWPYGRDQRAELERGRCPASVPWAMVAPHEAQAKRNHDQTLEELARRGGLSPRELLAVLNDWPWNKVRALLVVVVAAELNAKVEQWRE